MADDRDVCALADRILASWDSGSIVARMRERAEEVARKTLEASGAPTGAEVFVQGDTIPPAVVSTADGSGRLWLRIIDQDTGEPTDWWQLATAIHQDDMLKRWGPAVASAPAEKHAAGPEPDDAVYRQILDALRGAKLRLQEVVTSEDRLVTKGMAKRAGSAITQCRVALAALTALARQVEAGGDE